MATETLDRAGPTVLASGSGTVFTVPALTTYSFRTMRIMNPTGGAITVRLGRNGVTDSDIILEDRSIAAGGRMDYDGLEVFEPGDTLQATTTGAGLVWTGSYLKQA